jgi:hypothetical protein
MLFHVGGTAARTGWGMGVCRTSFFCFHVQIILGKCKGIEIWGICKGFCYGYGDNLYNPLCVSVFSVFGSGLENL